MIFSNPKVASPIRGCKNVKKLDVYQIRHFHLIISHFMYITECICFLVKKYVESAFCFQNLKGGELS